MDFQPLKDFLDCYLPMLGIPGADTAVYLDHEEIFRYQSGYDNSLLRTPVRKDALYNVYSCTKISTMVAAAQLIERGEISILDPVYAYIPEFKDITVKIFDDNGNAVGSRPAKRPMLIKHLLSMTSGLDYTLIRPEVEEVIKESEGRAPTLDVCRALAKAPLEFDPGEHFKYSLSHDVMAGVIESVTGQRFADYVKENVFHPLGMFDTDFHPDPRLHLPCRAAHAPQNPLCRGVDDRRRDHRGRGLAPGQHLPGNPPLLLRGYAGPWVPLRLPDSRHAEGGPGCGPCHPYGNRPWRSHAPG